MLSVATFGHTPLGSLMYQPDEAITVKLRLSWSLASRLLDFVKTLPMSVAAECRRARYSIS